MKTQKREELAAIAQKQYLATKEATEKKLKLEKLEAMKYNKEAAVAEQKDLKASKQKSQEYAQMLRDELEKKNEYKKQQQ